MAAVRRLLSPADTAHGDLPSMTLSLAVTLAFFLATFALASLAARGHTEGDLQ